MTVTLLASADEPQPQPDDAPQPQPQPTPPGRTRTWWHPSYAQHSRGLGSRIPRQRTAGPCCDLNAGGDRCTCRRDLGEYRRAMRHPIVLDLSGGAR